MRSPTFVVPDGEIGFRVEDEVPKMGMCVQAAQVGFAEVH